jgi:hypothetical protein
MVAMTPERIGEIDSAVDLVLNDPAFHAAVQRLGHELIDAHRSFGYERPTTSSLQSAHEKQRIPAAPGSADLLVSENKFVEPHLAAALELDSPFSSIGSTQSARPDLCAAVEWTASFRGDTGAIDRARAEKTRVFGEIRTSLANVDAKLRSLQTVEAAGVQQPGSSIALYAAAVRAAGIPDTKFAHSQVRGFQAIGDIPDSGMFRSVERAATKSFDELCHPAHNTHVARTLRREAARASAPGGEKRQYMLDVLTSKTRKEVAAGHAFGPYTAAELDAKFGGGAWRCLHRFGVPQGLEADGVTVKIRACDNGRSGQHNACTATHETIACEDAAFPMLAADLFDGAFAALGLPRMPLQHSTDDVDSAYRRMACGHPEATVVAIFDTKIGDVRYYTMNGFNFGLLSAVLAFNRHSQIVAMVARRFFGVCVAGYFDDYDITEPTFAGRTGKRVLRQLHVWLGMPLATGAKDVGPSANGNAFLGVISDLSRFVDGEAYIRSKPTRVAKLVTEIERYLEHRIPPDDPLSLFGKLEFTTSSAGYCRIGRAALATLRAWHTDAASHAPDTPLPPAVLEALAFFSSVLPRLPARRFAFGERRNRRKPIVLYTDAMYERSAAVPAQIGITIYDPEDVGSLDAPCGYRHASAPVPPDFMAALLPRQQQIGPLETVAPLVAMLSRPEQFRDREVILFVDNTQAVYTLASGYARQHDTARLVHMFHCLCAALGARVWLEYVPSGANIADQPSRGEFALLQRLGSTSFCETLRWPDMAPAWTGVFERVFAEFAPRPSKAEKRARARVAEAIDDERARRACVR